MHADHKKAKKNSALSKLIAKFTAYQFLSLENTMQFQ